ncbi:recombinase family protein [Geobacillus kaustophilus]|uniref:recombinase family protein n=1 Tax=Geobacillus kaustophilus TaxID=1462 RepID=UPI0012E05C83
MVMDGVKKRVATLYRVSTKGQLDGDDIPMQRNACRSFIEKQGNWELVKEYIEKGFLDLRYPQVKGMLFNVQKKMPKKVCLMFF